MNDGAGIINEKQFEDAERDFEDREKEYRTTTSTPASSQVPIPPVDTAPRSERLDDTEKPKKRLKSKKNKKGQEVAAEEEQDPFAHLPDHEKAILKRQLDVPPVSTSYKTLFRYATGWDIAIMCVGAFCAIAGG